MKMRQILGVSCSLPGSYLSIWGHRVSREDLEAVIDLLRVAASRWPTAESLKTQWRCSCGWEGDEDARIPISGKGTTGCPRCGEVARPIFSEHEQGEPDYSGEVSSV